MPGQEHAIIFKDRFGREIKRLEFHGWLALMVWIWEDNGKHLKQAQSKGATTYEIIKTSY